MDGTNAAVPTVFVRCRSRVGGAVRAIQLDGAMHDRPTDKR
jgi:hypothetical protein